MGEFSAKHQIFFKGLSVTEKKGLSSKLVNFPEMHPELVPYSLPEAVLFLDPGLPGKERDLRYLDLIEPELDKRQAAKILTEWLQLGERFADAGGLAYFAQAGLEDFYEHTSLAIRSELYQVMGNEGNNKNHLQKNACMKSQVLLLLAWTLEDRLCELHNLDEHIQNSWVQFNQELGIESREERFSVTENMFPSLQGLENTVQALPWELILESFLCFLPPDADLFTTYPAVSQGLQNKGLEMHPITSQAYLSLLENVLDVQAEKWVRIYEPGWVLTGKEKPSAERPWLNRKVSIIFQKN